MTPQPHEGPAEEGLSCSVLRLLDHPDQIDQVRQLLGCFNHRCRNTLNGIKMSLYLSKRELQGPMPASWLELERNYQDIEQLFDRLQMIYRPLRLSMVRSPLGQLIEERLPGWRSILGSNGQTLQLIRPDDAVSGDFDPMHLGLALDAFVAWRAVITAVPRRCLLSWRGDEEFCELGWSEEPIDGIGTRCNSEIAQTTPTIARRGGDCLAVPLLARIIHAHGGDQEIASAPGFTIRLRWPRFHGSDEPPCSIRGI
jgi:hypothetical protein